MPWLGLYVRHQHLQRSMLWTSGFTALFGLSEPLFVPAYWNPPSLFDLAHRTGFDIESLIFSFGIGGVGAVLYPAFTSQGHRTVGVADRHAPLHRRHWLAIAAPFIAFPSLYALGWNPIYPAIMAMVLGGVATMLCRRDLRRTAWVGSGLFAAYYLCFLVGLRILAPGYIERVWNLSALSGVRPAGFPIEELLFGAAFGLYWSGVYEHLTWHSLRADRKGLAADRDGESPQDRSTASPSDGGGRQA